MKPDSIKKEVYPMKTPTLITTAIFIVTHSAYAQGPVEKRLFTMRKSYNPTNILIVNSQTDEDCKFVRKNKEYIDLYWLMDGKNRKEINPMIRSEIQNKVQFKGINSKKDSFKVKLNDLRDLKHDLEDTTIEVSSEIINGNCNTKSVLKLGSSSKYRKLNLKKTFCEVTTNLIGVPNGCAYVELQGVDADSGEKLKVRFNSK